MICGLPDRFPRQNELTDEGKMEKRHKMNIRARLDSLRKTFVRHLVKHEEVSNISVHVLLFPLQPYT